MLDLDLLTTSYHEKFLMIGNVQTDELAIGKYFACEQSSHDRDRSDINSSWKKRFILVCLPIAVSIINPVSIIIDAHQHIINQSN